MSKHYDYSCFQCGTGNNERETSTYCTQCGGVLTVRYHQAKKEIQFPLKETPPDPLRTTSSELRHLKRLSARYGVEIWAKLEFQNPTGCFKDRGSYVEVLKAIELGAEAICLASTGNMAASVAAYACYFKKPCYVFVPENTPDGKLAQATMFGARILKIKGDFSTCEQLCRQFAKTGPYYLAGDYVFREEGQKSFSFELLEQGGTFITDVLVPVGCGTNFGAIFKGFKEAMAGGITASLPRMVAIQPQYSSPVVEGISKGRKVIKNQVSTVATAVAAADPIDFYKVLEGIRETEGLSYTVTEEDILLSLKEMALEEGIFTEPACALPLAALKNNLSDFKNRKVLLVLTGSGMKDTGVVTKYSLPSPVLRNDVNQVQEYLKSGFIEIQQSAWGKARETMVVNLNLDPKNRKIYDNYIAQFERKGKQLTNRELEVLQTLAMMDVPGLEYPVKVLDYDVRVRKNGLVKATVTMLVDGNEIVANAKGVGVVDASIQAVATVAKYMVPLQLLDHRVEIINPDTNSLVVVTLKLSDGTETFDVKEASTDMLEAALMAYTKGLALFRSRQQDQQTTVDI
jgi:threonine synthase